MSELHKRIWNAFITFFGVFLLLGIVTMPGKLRPKGAFGVIGRAVRGIGRVLWGNR
jgi:hypothetical protein